MTLSVVDFEQGVEAYWSEVARRSAAVQRREREFPRFAELYATRKPPHFERGDLETIMWWKHTDSRWRDRALRGLAAVSDVTVQKVTARVQALDEPEAAYRSLVGFAHGVDVASISAILAAARPDYFPVIDVFALVALERHLPEPWHRSIPRDAAGRPTAHARIYPPFVQTCRTLAARCREDSGTADWTPRRVDMALWGIGKAAKL